eukprot:scaffold22817_cov34-Attheya_sp.AAC.2
MPRLMVMDYVVFLIGSRANKCIDPFYKWMGDAFKSTNDELETADPSLGYLGSKMFVGATGTCIIQYWRSANDLNAYVRNSSKKHVY